MTSPVSTIDIINQGIRTSILSGLSFRYNIQERRFGGHATVEIKNLIDDTVSNIVRNENEIIIKSGCGILGTIFNGIIRGSRDIDNRLKGDRTTILTCVSMLSELKRRRLSFTGCNARLSCILSEILSQTNIRIGHISPDLRQVRFRNIFYFDILENILKDLSDRTGAIWFVENNLLNFLSNNDFLPNSDIIVDVNDVNNGLRDSPEIITGGVRITVTLMPNIRIGRRLILNSDTISGIYRIVEIEHFGAERIDENQESVIVGINI